MLVEGDVSRRILGFMGVRPRRLSEIVDGVGCAYSYGSDVLRGLVGEGLVLVSEESIIESYLDRQGRRRFRRGRLFIRADSPLVKDASVVAVLVRRVKRYTLEEYVEEVQVRFVRPERLKKRFLTSGQVLRFFEERGWGRRLRSWLRPWRFLRGGLRRFCIRCIGGVCSSPGVSGIRGSARRRRLCSGT